MLAGIQLYFLLTLSKLILFELPVLIPLVFYLIHSVSVEGALNWISRIRFRCTFIWPWVNHYMVYGFDFSSIGHFPAMVCSISAEGSLNLAAHWIYIFLLLALSKSFPVYFVCIWWSFTAYLSLFRLSLILAACSESWYWKLEFSVTSFWFYNHRLWWSSWHGMFGVISLISILVWIFSVTCSRLQELTLVVFFTFLFQFIIFEQVKLYFCLLRLVYCIVGITLCHLVSHRPLFLGAFHGSFTSAFDGLQVLHTISV